LYVRMCLCMYACLNACKYVYMLVCMHVCMYVCMFVYRQVCLHACMTCTYVCIHEWHARMHVRVYALMYACMHVFIVCARKRASNSANVWVCVCMCVLVRVSVYWCKSMRISIDTPQPPPILGLEVPRKCAWIVIINKKIPPPHPSPHPSNIIHQPTHLPIRTYLQITSQ